MIRRACLINTCCMAMFNRHGANISDCSVGLRTDGHRERAAAAAECWAGRAAGWSFGLELAHEERSRRLASQLGGNLFLPPTTSAIAQRTIIAFYYWPKAAAATPDWTAPPNGGETGLKLEIPFARKSETAITLGGAIFADQRAREAGAMEA